LNEAAQTQVAQPENPGISAPFDVQKELAEKLLTKLQKCLKTLAISKEGSKLYLPVTADERSSLDTLMLEISKHWQSQTPQAPGEQMTEGEQQQPETIADVFDTLREDNEMLTEQKQSLSEAVEQLLNPLKPLIVKVLGKQGLQPLGECCTVAAVAEEIGNILKGDFSTKLDELIASQSALKHESERLQKELAQNQKELVQSQKKASEQETKLQENKGPAEKLRKLVQLLSEPRKTFRDQNPLTILEKAAGIAETTQVSVDVWKGGLATGVAHIIKDLLRRILTLVPQLHTANPKRNAPWINNLLDVMEGVSQETDKLVDGFRQQAQTKGLDEFLGALQEVVCRGGLPTN
jgi:regulator of replication initiation timing